MSIRSIASAASPALTPTSSVTSTSKAQRSRSSAPPPRDAASVSGPAQTMNKLQALQKSDPAKFKEVMSAISDKLSSAAQASTNPAEQKALTDAAARFKSAGDTGDLSALTPQKDGATGRGKRGAETSAGGGAASSTPSAASASTGQGATSATVASPADANGDGAVSTAEQIAYDAKQSATSSGAQRAYGRHGHEGGHGGGAFAQIGAIVDSVLASAA